MKTQVLIHDDVPKQGDVKLMFALCPVAMMPQMD